EALAMSSRYIGKPFLRLLECYVLATIGELQEKEAKTLVQMTSKLQQVYSLSGSWLEIVSQVMNFPPDIDDHLRRLWEHNHQIAEQCGERLAPNAFAIMVVDSNFH